MSSYFVIYTPGITGVYWLRADALGAERDIEVNNSNKTFEQKGAKITFHIYNDSCLQIIYMGWLSKFESAHRLMEGVDGWESYLYRS